ncbi:hypothetical protein SDC9_111246 [bioreactor metagenome]|uniref:Uncharacterized protein n=1 Tax=bioreactor metagenome TaxID=1076179 RepID=A0A645BFZ4_9ZZZZ|nr:DUF134 domain-containing protein [Candidatus Pelethousia sp.]
MPRPRKWRKVCRLPKASEFAPLIEKSASLAPVTITVDEYETIRLIDNEGFTQEECSGYMKIARTTVQQVYNNARKKLAHALVEGLPFKIEGGDYLLCDGKEAYCGCGGCRKHGCKREAREEAAFESIRPRPD